MTNPYSTSDSDESLLTERRERNRILPWVHWLNYLLLLAALAISWHSNLVMQGTVKNWKTVAEYWEVVARGRSRMLDHEIIRQRLEKTR